MRYQSYRKLNTVALVVLVGCGVLVIFGLVYAMDYFRKPNFFSFLFIGAALVQIIRLIIDYRKSRLGKET